MRVFRAGSTAAEADPWSPARMVRHGGVVPRPHATTPPIPMPPAISAAELLRRLPVHATPEDVRPIAHEVARAASRSRYPGKSIAQTVRCVQRAGHPPALAMLLGTLAQEELRALDERPVPLPALTPLASWLTVEQTAEMLRKNVRTIRSWLETTEGRRMLGWPFFDGASWQIPEPAINPATRAAYMAEMPIEEPLAHRATLPVGYRSDAAA